ncbi:MAG: hypothetical protein PWP59_1929 [Sphaerochaeta sp.]|jgi:hypothetical protein|nr:hypothetical protein [Sphaerochaeta sp.]
MLSLGDLAKAVGYVQPLICGSNQGFSTTRLWHSWQFPV